jgi:hypothetical protein
MKKPMAGRIDYRKNPPLDHESVQALRCWVLLSYIIGKEREIKPPAIIKTAAKRKTTAGRHL